MATVVGNIKDILDGVDEDVTLRVKLATNEVVNYGNNQILPNWKDVAIDEEDGSWSVDLLPSSGYTPETDYLFEFNAANERYQSLATVLDSDNQEFRTIQHITIGALRSSKSVYQHLKDIIEPGTGISLSYDDDTNEITITRRGVPDGPVEVFTDLGDTPNELVSEDLVRGSSDGTSLVFGNLNNDIRVQEIHSETSVMLPYDGTVTYTPIGAHSAVRFDIINDVRFIEDLFENDAILCEIKFDSISERVNNIYLQLVEFDGGQYEDKTDPISIESIIEPQWVLFPLTEDIEPGYIEFRVRLILNLDSGSSLSMDYSILNILHLINYGRYVGRIIEVMDRFSLVTDNIRYLPRQATEGQVLRYRASSNRWIAEDE